LRTSAPRIYSALFPSSTTRNKLQIKQNKMMDRYLAFETPEAQAYTNVTYV